MRKKGALQNTPMKKPHQPSRKGLADVVFCVRAAPHNSARSLRQDFCPNSKFGKRRNTVCTRKGYAASVSQLALATAALYFSFFKLKKWGKKTAETRRRNCAVLP